MKSLSILLAIIIFVSGFITEISNSVSFHQIPSSAQLKTSFYNQETQLSSYDKEEDSHESDCHQKTEQCAHHCSGLHNLCFFLNSSLGLVSYIYPKKNLFFSTQYYSDPHLNQLIKPPTLV